MHKISYKKIHNRQKKVQNTVNTKFIKQNITNLNTKIHTKLRKHKIYTIHNTETTKYRIYKMLKR